MFRNWEKYAEVFSALDITEQNHSRVGMVADAIADAVLIFYGLNMTGASVSMILNFEMENPESFARKLRTEGITDLLLFDTFLAPEDLDWICRERDSLELRNIILFHDRVSGPFAPPEMQMQSRRNRFIFRRFSGVLFMDDLLERYESTPIIYGSSPSLDEAVIIHTSGTTNGIHKPVPLSDRALNEAVARHLRSGLFDEFEGRTVSVLGMELSAVYSLADMMQLPFAFGGEVVTVPMGIFNPYITDAIRKYRVNSLFCTAQQFEEWIRYQGEADLSRLKYVSIGGSYVSADAKKRYETYLKQCGTDIGISIGYGLSEAGGGCILAPADRKDDAIGYPLPGVKVKIFDEDEEKYYDLEDGPRTGVLCLSTGSLSGGKIDDTVYFELDEIDGEKYLNTYDLVTVNDDGSMTCIGRMNKYFVNNEGIRFDAGLVETATAAQPGIILCGLAPEYEKMIHDTIPVLYVQTEGSGKEAVQTVRQALINVFIYDNMIVETNLPGQCVISDQIPLTATGKVDVHRIAKEGAVGKRYKVQPVRNTEGLTDIRLEYVDASSDPSTWAGLPDELEDAEYEEEYDIGEGQYDKGEGQYDIGEE